MYQLLNMKNWLKQIIGRRDMKFCKRRKHEYKNSGGVVTTCDYIVQDDVVDFHGKEFADKWLEFIKYKPRTFIDGHECFFYSDYEYAARQTNSFLHPEN